MIIKHSQHYYDTDDLIALKSIGKLNKTTHDLRWMSDEAYHINYLNNYWTISVKPPVLI